MWYEELITSPAIKQFFNNFTGRLSHAFILQRPLMIPLHLCQNWWQVCGHVNSGLFAQPNQKTCLQPNFMFTCHPAAGPTFTRTDFSRCAFQLSAVQHHLSWTRCHKQFSSATLLFVDLIFFIHSGFHWTLIWPAASASEVTPAWHYLN